ncbi:MAG: lipopolysaccharide transport system ATP-binding protein [Bradyrhizobium sp.]|jgi:ABC-2 type transport system ATP-binding protein/lipopolysaccharide transport system ATP-binding protein|nr:lipopolysaccharide transport system ATP-binding protein [Bradyrhizobium sp.]
MTSIVLDRVTVDFPIYNARGRSLKSALLRRTVGGRIETTPDRHVSVLALRDINLTLNKGDRLGLIGRNGAGKSTLLRVLSGVYEPPIGTVKIEGAVSALTDMMMGMDIEATGYENIILRSVFLGISVEQAKRSVPEIEEFSELGDFMHLPMRTYSSGMMLRLAFAVTTAVTPEILIMDEVIGAGDSAFLEKAQARLNRIIGDSHILVIATHSDFMMRQFCNKAALMESGRLVMLGTVDEVLDAYHGR